MTTDILSLTEITENQAGKYLTHNEALRQIEAMLVRVLSRTNSGVPASPSAGDVYIVDDASGDWSGGSLDDIAHYYSGAWHFYTPIEGLSIWCVDEDLKIYYTGSQWMSYSSTALPADFDQDPDTTTGLTFGYKAGTLRNDNEIVSVSAGTVSLTDDATNYIEVDSAGIVSANTTSFTSGQIPLHEVVTASGAISSVTDKRTWIIIGGGGSGGINVEDDGSVVVSDSTAINFGSDLNVTDDGDGTASIAVNTGKTIGDIPQYEDDGNAKPKLDSQNAATLIDQDTSTKYDLIIDGGVLKTVEV